VFSESLPPNMLMITRKFGLLGAAIAWRTALGRRAAAPSPKERFWSSERRETPRAPGTARDVGFIGKRIRGWPWGFTTGFIAGFIAVS
jgi:uncharacterized membrane protein YfcA